MIFKILLKTFMGFRVEGQENVPKRGPFIMAANHVSLIDPPVIGATCHTVPLVFMAKRELFETVLFGWWFRAVGCIPTERVKGSAKPLKEALHKLKEGKSLGIFPEGTRSRDGQLQEPEAGIGLIVGKSGVPVVPVYISGTDKALSKGKRFIRPTKVTARVGRAVHINVKDSGNSRNKRDIYESISKKIMDAIARLKNE